MAEEKIKRAFLEYAKENELSALNTSYFFAKQFLPDKSLFLKIKVIEDLKEVNIMKIKGDKWIIQE